MPVLRAACPERALTLLDANGRLAGIDERTPMVLRTAGHPMSKGSDSTLPGCTAGSPGVFCERDLFQPDRRR